MLHRFIQSLRPLTQRRRSVFDGVRRRGLLLGLSLGVAALPPPLPPLPPLVLRAAPLRLSAPQFYVAAVVDARADRKAVAYLLLPPARAGAAAAAQPVDFAGGGRAAIQQFMQQSGPQAAAGRRAVTVRLTKCLVTEAAGPGAAGQVQGQVTVALAFEWQRNGQPVYLTEYHASARYGRPAGQLTVVEPTLRTVLGNGLRYLNAWLLAADGHNPRVAQGVRVTFRDYTTNTDPDTLFYAPDHRLIRADFQGPQRPGRFVAAVFPSFSFSARPTFEQGFVHLAVQTKVFVVRQSSWISPAASNEAEVLNHEQRHFDLVKLVAERFKHKIQSARLTVDDFNATIQLAYFTSFQEMNRLQEQYDRETSHGTNAAAQQAWNRRLDAELRALPPLR
ncbi:DUF922 domain-containing protein [Hymenobacter algoricola]|uniref:DUF922 domain-containing protein n=1 Tax=Hymenobacter algoricola TaxID=486267 RepID=A0ABP7MEP2_9BACT